MKQIILASLVLLTFSACKKIEGEGGRGTITGKIKIDEKLYVNGLFTQTVSYDGATEDVYIVYGDEDLAFDDKVECSYDGSFEFNFLQPGTYTVFAYSEIFNPGNNVGNNDDDYYTRQVVKQTIEVGKKQTVDLGTITLIK